jgi:hypothetical protein
VKDQTAEIYNEIVQEMGDKYFQGYQTETESEEEEGPEEVEPLAALDDLDETSKNDMK